jgi:endonuclease/exonuclease/phosphatase family metal-dependent hydrolase
LSNLAQQSQASPDRTYIEQVRLESGLYFGDRNTEPRAALVVHLVYDPRVETDKLKETRKPLDIFVVNLHLTTLMMEREGIPEIDEQASRIRIAQLSIVFNGIVSRYNSWRQQGYPQRGVLRPPEPREIFQRHPPVWVLAGDFNFTQESSEYAQIRRQNFIDAVPQKGNGTKAKGAGTPATLTLDYVFAGPKFISLDPLIEERGLRDNAVDHNVFASDHYPMFASIPLDIVAS